MNTQNINDNHIDSICERLITFLPTIANTIIEDRTENGQFIINPDDPNEHVPIWHQFGIITHTKFVLKIHQTEASEYIDKWGIRLKINSKLQEEVDGKPKSELILIGIILHDIGKFARNFKENDGKMVFNFIGHEAMSEKLIKENKFIYNLLNQTLEYTEAQINYIARCAGLHFELGKAREAAKKTKLKYTIAFSESKECLESCIEIATQFPEYKLEIGILFLCDSLGKIDVRIIAESDEDIENLTPQIKQVLAQRNLNPSLLSAIKQLPVNIAIAKRYLENV